MIAHSRRRFFSRWLRLACIAAVSLALHGCAQLFPNHWRPGRLLYDNFAISHEMRIPTVEGAVWSETAPNKPEYMIYSYRADRSFTRGFKYYFAAKLDEHGAPVNLAYRGTQKKKIFITDDIRRNQFESIAQYVFSREEARLGRRLMASKQFKQQGLDSPPPTVRVMFGDAIYRDVTSGVSVYMFPYAWDDGNLMEQIRSGISPNNPWWGGWVGREFMLAPHFQVMVIPGTQPMKKTDLTINAACKTLASPFIVIGMLLDPILRRVLVIA